MQNKKIGFIGAGTMAENLINCFISKKLILPKNIIASCPQKSRLNYLNKKYKIKTTTQNQEVADNSDMIILATKPYQLQEALNGIVNIEKKLIISILAGIKIKKIQDLTKSKIIRIMPNLCCAVNHSAGGYCINEKTAKQDEKLFLYFFEKIGVFFKVEENQLNIITAISGSGPGFFAYFIDEFAKAGIKNKLPKNIAYSLALNTAFGTAKYLIDTKTEPKNLIKKIATKQGTTEAGLKIIKKSNMDKIIFDVVLAAKNRAEEIGEK